VPQNQGPGTETEIGGEHSGISGIPVPVIIAPTDYHRWLTAPADTAKKLLVQYARGMTISPVSDRVNCVKNDDAALLRPITIS
jgi:putative SOS response-associated peptidase YedK